MVAGIVSVITTLLFYLSLFLAGLWMWFQWSHRDLLRAAAEVPVTRHTVPLLGHAYLILWGLEETTRSLLKMSFDAVAKGLRSICFWCGPLPIIALLDADDINVILNGINVSERPTEYEYSYAGFDSGVGPFRHNLLSSRGQTWKLTRKHLVPMFQPHNVQHLVPMFNKNSRELVARMCKHVGQGPFNVLGYAMDVSLKSICNVIFGRDVHLDVKSESFQEVIRVLEMVTELFIRRLIRPWLRLGWLFQVLYRKEVKWMNYGLNNFTKIPLKLAKEKDKQQIKVENVDEGNDRSTTNVTQGQLNILDLYSPLQQKHPEFTEADMLCEMFALYGTGTDTVGTATSSCLLALAQYQDIQERLYKEIVSVVGLEDDVTLEDLVKMPYLDQVIKETLRWFLIVPFVLREVLRDLKLSDCSLPAGSTICCSIAAVHMNPSIYKDPHKFDPDRFSPENSPEKLKCRFIPFSAGPRICIAKTYSMHLMKMQIIHVLRNFRVTTKQDIHKLKRKFIVTLVSMEGYNICVEKRTLNDTGVRSD